MHPGKDGFSALPYFDDFDLSTVDILLISQYVTIPLLLICAGETIFPLGDLLCFWGSNNPVPQASHRSRKAIQMGENDLYLHCCPLITARHSQIVQQRINESLFFISMCLVHVVPM